MVNSTLNRAEENVEISCSKMTNNPLDNFQLPFTLSHLTFPDQYSVILIF